MLTGVRAHVWQAGGRSGRYGAPWMRRYSDGYNDGKCDHTIPIHTSGHPAGGWIKIARTLTIIHSVLQPRKSRGGRTTGDWVAGRCCNSVADDQRLAGRPPHRPASQSLIVRHAIAQACAWKTLWISRCWNTPAAHGLARSRWALQGRSCEGIKQ